MIHHSAVIHSKAHVDRESCRVGAGTKIHQFASVTRGTILGEDCSVWPFAMLDGPVFGDRCKIASGVAMGAGFLVGDDVFIGPNVTVCNDMWPEVSLEGYEDAMLRNGVDFSVIIEDGVSIGANAVIMPGIRIGAGSVIGAGCIVRSDVVPGVLIYPSVADGEFQGLCQMRMDPVEQRRARRMRWAR